MVLRLRLLTLVLVVLTALAMLSVIVLAAENGEADPWEGIMVTFGGITIAWASAQMGILQVLKSVRIKDKPLLNSSGTIWLTNAALGVLGMVLAATQAGTPWLGALVQAIIAVFAASGEFEFLKKASIVGNPSGPPV